MHSSFSFALKKGSILVASSRVFHPLLRATRAVKEMGRGFPLQKYNFCGASSEAKGEWGNVDSGKAVAKTSCHKCADVARMIDRAKVKKAIRTRWLLL